MALYSILYWLFMGVSAALFFVGAVVIWLVTWPFDRNRKLLHLYSCFWAQTYYLCHPFWRLRIEGRSKLPWSGPAVIVANHQSLGDILVLFGLYRPFKWVSKASVFKVPFIGWNMMLNNYVGLVRGNKDSIIQMMNECHAWLKKGVPVLMFPEGTRSEDGELGTFKKGAAVLAIQAQVPLVPMAITGTKEILPKGFNAIHGGKVRLKIGEPIPTKGMSLDDRTALTERLREEIEKLYESIR